MEYGWKAGARFKHLDAQQVADELERIREKRGVLDASAVVAEAKSKKSILHDCFEWDDTIAANKYREDQARLIIRSIVVIREDIQVGPAFIAIEREDCALRDYVSAPTLRTMDASRLQALEDCRRDLVGLRKRYDYLSELATIWEVIDGEIG